MKFVVRKEEFSRLINMVQTVAAVRPTIPILANVLVACTEDGLVVTATDLTVGMRAHIPAKVLETGATTIPAKRLGQLIKELTASSIEFSSDTNEVAEIIADSSRFKLHGMSQGEYPALPDLEEAMQFAVTQSALRTVLYRTAFAVARDENRYILTGVLVKIENGEAIFVGTDGKRLAKDKIAIDLDPSFSGEYVLPVKAIDELMKVLTDTEDKVMVYLMDNKVAFSTENSTVITKLLAGEYPDFTRVIPDNPETEVVLHRDEMMTLLRQVALFTAEDDHSVRFSFVTGELRLQANSMDIGEGKVSMPVNYEGDRFDVAFNPNYFLDILRHSKDETVTLHLTDAYNPGIITDSTDVLFVLMPMRLN